MKHHIIRFITTVWLGLMAVNAMATTRYVDLNNPTPTPPFTSWATAATNIQHAVNASFPGDVILVTNGVYEVGSQTDFPATVPSRVSLWSNFKLQSVNGPAVTTIKGYQLPGTTNGNGAIRCAYLANGAVLSGFTLTNGATAASGVEGVGAVKCQSTTATVTNCIFVGNAGYSSGGAYSGTLMNCVFTKNWSSGGAGGANQSILVGCILTNNTSGYRGGGAIGGSLTNCLVMSNSAPVGFGGGCDSSTLVNCTVVGNLAQSSGGGTEGCTLINSIVYYNSIKTLSASGTNQSNTISPYNNCTLPAPGTGANNFSTPPLFTDLVGGNLRLQNVSPCRNIGTNLTSLPAFDLDRRPRLLESRVDVGAYEFQGTNMSQFIGWLQTNNLPTDTSSDYADPDTDGANNWQEWVAGTIPTNPTSVLRMLSTSTGVTGLDVTWSSVSGKSYWIERATEWPSFSTVVSNLAGQAVTTTFSDTAATNAESFFYRVGVQ